MLSTISAGVQPRWIQGIRSGDGVGEDQERLIVLGKELVSLKSQLLQLLLNCGVGEDS